VWASSDFHENARLTRECRIYHLQLSVFWTRSANQRRLVLRKAQNLPRHEIAAHRENLERFIS